MQLITVQFGSVGSSWFAVLREERGKLVGLRWTPPWSSRGNGNWGLTVVSLPSERRTDRVPTCARPQLPMAAEVTRIMARTTKQAAEAKAKRDVAKAFAKRLDAGETITLGHAWSRWNWEEKRYDAEGNTVRVVKAEGRWLLCEAPVPLPHGLIRILASEAEESEAS